MPPRRPPLRARRALAAWLAAFALIGASPACGGSGDDSGDGPPGSPPGGGPVTFSLRRRGFVHTLGTSVDARFFDASDRNLVCTERELDGCRIVKCPDADPHGVTAVVRPFVSAGALTVSGPSGNVGGAPDRNGAYTLRNESSPWPPGEAVTIAASGGVVPAFQGTITVPEGVTVTEPALPPSSFDLQADRAAGLPAKWSGGGEANVEVWLVQAAAAAQEDIHVVCTAKASRGEFLVSPAVVGELNRFSTTLVYIGAVARGSAAAGDYAIDLLSSGPQGFTARVTFVDAEP